MEAYVYYFWNIEKEEKDMYREVIFWFFVMSM